MESFCPPCFKSLWSGELYGHLKWVCGERFVYGETVSRDPCPPGN